MATHFEAIIVGSGIGGLSFALNLAQRGHSVAIVTKKTSSESNTNWAQGGIACVTDQTDDFQSHVKDTVRPATAFAIWMPSSTSSSPALPG